MYEKPGSVKEIVDLPADEALSRAGAFLTGQGYATVRRAPIHRKTGARVLENSEPQEGGPGSLAAPAPMVPPTSVDR